MKISKQDALNWFRFFASLPEEETPGCRQQDDTVSRHAFLAYHAGSRGQKPVPAPRM